AELLDMLGAQIRADAFAREGARDDIDRFLYKVIWEPLPSPAAAPADVAGTWLILAAEGDAVAAELCDLLAQHGGRPVLATLSGAYREITATRFELPLTERADVRRLLARAAGDAGALRGVISMLGTSAEGSLDSGSLAVRRAVTLTQAILEMP